MEFFHEEREYQIRYAEFIRRKFEERAKQLGGSNKDGIDVTKYFPLEMFEEEATLFSAGNFTLEGMEIAADLSYDKLALFLCMKGAMNSAEYDYNEEVRRKTKEEAERNK